MIGKPNIKGNIIKGLVAACAIGALAFAARTCSDIQQFTYLLRSNADAEPHTVELWKEATRPNTGWVRVYDLRFPQYYYAYEDNQFAVKQSAIGLLIDKGNLLPLAESVAREQVIDLTKASKAQKESVVRGMKAADHTRSMLVVITGDSPLRPPRASDRFLGLYVAAGEQAGFDLFVPRASVSSPKNPPELVGYSRSDPLVRVHCSGGSIEKNCGFDVNYKSSRVHFALPRSEFDRARPVAQRLLQLLQAHDVSSGRDAAKH